MSFSLRELFRTATIPGTDVPLLCLVGHDAAGAALYKGTQYVAGDSTLHRQILRLEIAAHGIDAPRVVALARHFQLSADLSTLATRVGWS